MHKLARLSYRQECIERVAKQLLDHFLHLFKGQAFLLSNIISDLITETAYISFSAACVYHIIACYYIIMCFIRILPIAVDAATGMYTDTPIQHAAITFIAYYITIHALPWQQVSNLSTIRSMLQCYNYYN